MLSFGNTLCAAQRLARPKSSVLFYEKLYTYVSPRVSACIHGMFETLHLSCIHQIVNTIVLYWYNVNVGRYSNWKETKESSMSLSLASQFILHKCPESARSLPGVCPEYAQILPRACPEPAQSPPGSRLEPTQSLPGACLVSLCPESARNLAGVCPESIWRQFLY